MTNDGYASLIGKLDEFIRKYYKNQLIRGALYAFTTVLAFYLVVTTLEYFGHFSTVLRTVLFYLFLLVCGTIVARLIVRPALKLYRLGAVITHEQAAAIIGRHFNEVSDKLLNTLQLKAQQARTGDSALLEASITQKINALRPVPFTAAIDLRRNLRYVRYAVVPAAVLVVLLFAAPSLLRDGTTRILNHAVYYERPAPFTFVILNEPLQTVQQEDFRLDVKIEGEEIPEQVFLETGTGQFRLEKENNVRFHYTFKSPGQDIPFELQAAGYTSKPYTLEVLPNPVVLTFSVSLDYPAYIRRANEVLNNTGDMVIPAGTSVRWDFRTRNTRALRMSFRDTSFNVAAADDDRFGYGRRFTADDTYSVVTSNDLLTGKDSMVYGIRVIPDLYPSIRVDEQADSMSARRLYFQGIIKDDYGFSKLNFCYRFLKPGDSLNRSTVLQQERLAINGAALQDQFFHFWDLGTLGIRPGEELEYYFEVWDNDGVHGPKSARSQARVFKAPTLKELEQDKEKNNSRLKDDLKESLTEAKRLQQEIQKTARKLLEKKELDYDDKMKIDDLLKQQRRLEEQVKDLSRQHEQNMSREREFNTPMEQIAEKQQQLQELFDQVMSDEMRKMMEELQRLMSELDKDRVQEMLENMKLDNKDLEKRLDRTLELFKQLEVEQKLAESIDQLQELAKKQDKLAEESLGKDADSKEQQEKQQALNDEFKDWNKDLEDLEKKNSELEFPQDLGQTGEDRDDIGRDMEDSEQQLGENQKKGASKKQKSAAGKMEQLAMKMQQMQQMQEMEQAEEDLNALRTLLENLIRFSFDQEALMTELKTADVNNPQYVKLTQEQRKLKDDARILEDSLLALSKRVIQIQSTVNEQMTIINDNLSRSIDHLQDRLVPVARSEQQYVMTSVNNLALMLSEAMQQMQQQMQSQSNSQCKKPGQGKPKSAADIRQMQEKLNQKLKELKGQMEKQGAQPKKGGSRMSEELARMAAEQEAIRNELQKLNQQENKDGQGTLGDLDKLAREMEDTERDLVNKRLTDGTLMRQQDILTRLLESEKAERQREMDEKRESNEGRDLPGRSDARFEEYKKLKLRETELLKTVPPSFNPFYKNLVNSYFQSLESNPP